MQIKITGIKRYKDRHGKWRNYHRKTGARLSDDLQVAAAEAVELNEKAKRAASQPPMGTVADLIATYKASSDFTRLKDRTRRDYLYYLRWYEDNFGDLYPSDIDREFVIDLRESFSDRPRTADLYVAMLSTLMGFALDRPSRFNVKENPAAGVKKIARGQHYKAWPESLYQAAIDAAYPELRNAIILAACTGQRRGDLIKLTRAHIRGDMLEVLTSKAGTRAMIPIHKDLQRMIDNLPAGQMMLAVNRQGRAWTGDNLTHEIGALLTKMQVKGYSLHGLRRLAANRLVEAGMTGHEIKAIIGWSTLQMVDEYTGEAQQNVVVMNAAKKIKKAGKVSNRGKKGV